VIKTPPSPLRLSALIGFVLGCVLLLTYLWINFGGSIPYAPRGYRIEVPFPSANELATGADVRIAGVNVGKVVGLTLDPRDSRTLATLQISQQYAPIARDTRATLRIKTLVGETFVALSSGERASGALPDGGRLPDGQVEPDVTLDQILSTFDPKTRQAFQTWMQAQAAAVLGRGRDINAFYGQLPPFFAVSQRMLTALNHQSAGLRGLVANTGEFFNAISARRGELSGLITASNSLFQTTAQRNRQLADVFRALPAFELQSRLALPAFTKFGQNADPVVRALEPIASKLRQTFADTAQLAPQLRGLFERLGPTVTASERGLPAFDRILNEIPPLLGAFEPFLRNGDPMVRYIGLFKPEITGFFGNATDAAQGSSRSEFGGRNVHYLRAANTLTPLALGFLPHPLGSDRDNAYRAPGAYNRLASGLSVLNSGECVNGNPAPPSGTTPQSLGQMIQQYVFRTSGSNVAAPPCTAQGPIAGFATSFPQLRVDPPPGVPAGG
jgi:phospholipid/cholesterol/gamma-HCH transport system substrate-binding protein